MHEPYYVAILAAILAEEAIRDENDKPTYQDIVIQDYIDLALDFLAAIP